MLSEKFIYEYIVCVHMTSVNISVKKDAYDFLRKLKSKDKSFSDVILSFKKDERRAMNFFGVLKNLDWNEKEERMKDLRRSFEKRVR